MKLVYKLLQQALWHKVPLELLKVLVGLLVLEPVQSHRIQELKQLLEVHLILLNTTKKEATPMMTMIDTANLSCLPVYHLRSRQLWIPKNLLYRYRCMRRCPRSIRDKRKKNSKKSISRRSAGRPSSILRKMMRHPVVPKLKDS